MRKGYILSESNYRTFWKRRCFGDMRKIRGCQGLGWGGRDSQGTEDFLRSDTSLNDTKMVYTCHCTFVQTHGMNNTQSELLNYVNPNVNYVSYGLWVTVMCPCRLIHCTKVPFWWGMLIMAEAVQVWGAGGI